MPSKTPKRIRVKKSKRDDVGFSTHNNAVFQKFNEDLYPIQASENTHTSIPFNLIRSSVKDSVNESPKQTNRNSKRIYRLKSRNSDNSLESVYGCQNDITQVSYVNLGE